MYEDMNDLKNALFNDDLFDEWLGGYEDNLDAWVELLEFKWVLTSQLNGNKVTQSHDDLWVKSITGLIVRTKARISEVQRLLRADGRQREYLDLALDMREARED